MDSPMGIYLMKNKLFLKWFLLFNLVLISSVLTWHYGVFERMYQADITKISFVIYALFLIFSIKIGHDCFKSRKRPITSCFRSENMYRFAGDAFLMLGMIGTVIGFIYMLSTVFLEIDPSNVSSLQGAISQMGTGLGTALYTTASGMICSLVLRVQTFMYSQYINRRSGG